MEVAPRPELTIRAVLTGMVIGALLTPCNVYSGLKIGWSFNMSIAAGLLGFGVWRLSGWAFRTGEWDLYENNINQTTASSSASIISGGLVAPIPALAILTGQTLPWPLLAVWVFVVSILGVVVAASLRNQMLVREKLRFPAGLATAETLLEIHAQGREAAHRLRVLLGGLVVSATLKLINSVHALPRPALPFSLPALGAAKGAAPAGLTATNLGFVFDPSLLMLGFGAIIGLRAGVSLLLGAVLAWGVAAPMILERGWARPGPADPGVSWFGPLVEWLLWPGVTMMVVAALTSFALVMGRILMRPRAARSDEAVTPVLPRRAFIAALLVTLAMGVAAQVGLFGIGLGAAVFAVLLAYVLAVVAARVSGETGITPIGSMGKITQLVFGVVTPGNVTNNLMSANVTGGAAGQCADLMHDLKTGEVIGATPRAQVVAQVFGVLTGSLVGTLVYLALVPDPKAMLLTPDWPAPAVAVWKAVAEVMAEGVTAIPDGAVPAMVVGGIVGFLAAVAEKLAPPRIATLVPSAPAFGLGFVIPAWIAMSLFIGAVLAAIAGKLAPDWTRRRLIALAAGLVAGESLMGVGLAAFDLLGR